MKHLEDVQYSTNYDDWYNAGRMDEEAHLAPRIAELERDRDAAIAAKERAEQRASEWEDAAAQGHPTPCTLGPLCPYCEIERLKSALALAVAECEAADELARVCDEEADAWAAAMMTSPDKRAAAMDRCRALSQRREAARRARTAAIAATSPLDDSKEDA